MNKKNVYCKGGPDFAKVYEKIKEKGLISGSINSSCLLKDNYEFGSSDGEDNILFSSLNYWSKDGSFTEVNPHEFSKVWLGYDCLEELTKDKVFCKGGPDTQKVIEEMAKHMDKMIVDGHQIRVSTSSAWGRKDVTVGLSIYGGNIAYADEPKWFPASGYTEVDAHKFSELWLGYDCLEEKILTKENVYCLGSEELAIVLGVLKDQGVYVPASDTHRIWTNPDCPFAFDKDRPLENRICYASLDRDWIKVHWGFTEVDAHTFSELWLGYDCITASDKGKIYCPCCSDFKKVIVELSKHPEKLIYKGRKIDVNPGCYMWDDNGCFAGLGTSNDTRITYCHNSEQYSSHGYKRVTPSEFSIAWLGYDCLTSSESLKKDTTFCKGSPELLKVLRVCKEKGVAGNYPTAFMASNPDIEVSKSICREENYIGFSEMHIYSKQHARTEIDAHQFSILWLGYDCLKEEELTKVYVGETHETPANEPEIPLVAPTKKNFKIIL